MAKVEFEGLRFGGPGPKTNCVADYIHDQVPTLRVRMMVSGEREPREFMALIIWRTVGRDDLNGARLQVGGTAARILEGLCPSCECRLRSVDELRTLFGDFGSWPVPYEGMAFCGLCGTWWSAERDEELRPDPAA